MDRCTTDVHSRECLATMRDWLSDLTFADVTNDEIDAMPDRAIVRGVARLYVGGIAQFHDDDGARTTIEVRA